jgi:ABC-type transport system involved in multi-copper enzyme maturation permease subunit
MNTTVKYVLLTALRDWLFLGILGSLIVSGFISYFMGSTVIVEKNEIASSFTAGSARLVLIVGMIVFVCFHVRRAFENKEIDLMLSRPISREQFVISYWLGFSVVATLIIGVLSLFIIAVYGYNYQGFSYWIITLLLEVFIVIAFAVFSSIILKSSVSSVLLCFGFYVVSRMIGFFGYVLEKNPSNDFLSFDFYTQKIIWVASFLLPRLDLFCQSKWLVYGVDSIKYNIAMPAIQALIYIPLLLVLAAIDFKKKQF